MRYTFQCGCGWSGQMEDGLLQEIFRPIWDGIIPKGGDGDTN